MLEIVGLTSVAGRRAGKFSLGMGQRLGIAAALFGDPEVLLFDEPVNGLDPDGIRWVRNLLKGLAREGRTVFVSSHLMSEMALTADEVIIVGKGRLITQLPTSELLAQSSQRFVRVRSPEIAQLQAVLDREGAVTTIEEDGSLSVRGLDEEAIGELASTIPVVLHELAPQSASLEEAYMELTEDSVEYHGGATGVTTCRRETGHEHGNGESAAQRKGTPAGTLRPLGLVALGVDQTADCTFNHVDSWHHRRRRDRDQRPGHAETRAHWRHVTGQSLASIRRVPA